MRYTNILEADNSFQDLRNISEAGLSKRDTLDPLTQERIENIEVQSKAGGLITQRGKWIFSLVETCRNTPIGGNWIDYENLFMSYLKNNSKERIEVLNADCGMMRYKHEER